MSVMQRLRRAFWSLYGRFVWDTQTGPWTTSQVRKIVQILQARRSAPGERVLDAGCGTGYHAVGLAHAGFHVTGIDYAAGMLARARDKVTDELSGIISFQRADLNARLGFPAGHFDHVINISVLQLTTDPALTLGELRRVLKPGGTLVLLHAPRPASHDLPLWQDIKRRVRNLEARTPAKIALVAAKACAERGGNTRYWTVSELREMVRASRFAVLSVDHGPPIVMVGEKVDATDSIVTPTCEHDILC